MEDNQKSNRPQMSAPDTDLVDHNDRRDEKIIDLTEIVTKDELESYRTSAQSLAAAVGEDDIIELTDIVQPQKVTAIDSGIAIGDEDEIIELTDIAQPETSPDQEMPPLSDRTTADEDDIIELTDMVQSQPADEIISPPIETDALAEQELIDLADLDLLRASADDTPDDQGYQEISGQLPDQHDYFQKQNQTLEDTLSELESMMDETFSGEESPIQLDDEFNGHGEFDLISDMSDEMIIEDAVEDDLEDFPIGIALDETSDDVVPDQQPPSLTNEQIDAAVERLIQNKWGQTIEQLVATTVEKIVAKQIESLRQSLLEDDDPIE